MKKFLLLFCLIAGIFADEIASKNEKLKQTSVQKEQLSQKLSDVANEILSTEKELAILEQKVQNASKKASELAKIASEESGELKSILGEQNKLKRLQSSQEKQLISLIAREFSYDLIAPKDMIESEQNILASEFVGALISTMQSDLSRLSSDYSQTKMLMLEKQNRLAILQKNLKESKEESKRLKKLKAELEALVSKQKRAKESYAKQINQLSKAQNELRKTLENLKIIAQQKKTQNQAKKNAKLDAKHSNQLALSSQTAHYKGKKTIAPLSEFTLKQPYGYFFDPIYKLKIFNENVILKSKIQNANVRAVLDGKIVFAGDTAVLEKVVIIEHASGIHTIYAHMNKLSQLARVGAMVKKGNIIGKIFDELSFEVTQKNYHINPAEFIEIKK